uniref:ZZ-type domain-containing protein n=1 Tax=Acrobeloides nanus TaxID=290746 RepID=A0A914D5W2_9BILA
MSESTNSYFNLITKTYTCDECTRTIDGIRYHCHHCCQDDYDLCSECYWSLHIRRKTICKHKMQRINPEKEVKEDKDEDKSKI